LERDENVTLDRSSRLSPRALVAPRAATFVIETVGLVAFGDKVFL
jgi:hypothetical protein